MIGRLRGAIKRGQRRISEIRANNRARRAVIRHLRREHAATVMFDSIDVAAIPRNAPAVAGYVGGRWPTWQQICHEFPDAKKLSIAVASTQEAMCLDIEPGDSRPDLAPAWVLHQQARGVRRPVLYASVSNMGVVLSYLKAAGIKRSEVRLWTAHYTFAPHVCGPASCGQLAIDADATQWTDHAGDGNLDESLVHRGFWDA